MILKEKYVPRHLTNIYFKAKKIYRKYNDQGIFDNNLENKITDYCRDHQGQLSKFVRDSLLFDKEVNIKREGKNISVEDDLLQLMEGEK